jgi:hypothetical protein
MNDKELRVGARVRLWRGPYVGRVTAIVRCKSGGLVVVVERDGYGTFEAAPHELRKEYA